MKDSKSTYSDLPQGWKIVQLQDIGKIVAGGTPSTKVAEYWEDEICWISPADLSGYNYKYISKGNKSISRLGLENSSAKLMPKGSILFSSRAPIGYVAIASNSLATNQGFKSLVPHDDIFNEYIYYYLKSAKQLAEKHANGTTFKEISAKAFASLPIPLPPLPEQHRIVEKIEELFSELDNGVASLKKALEQLKTYRQAVLKWAFEGKLTEEWRNAHQDILEDADTLLQQIKAERKRHYQQQLEDWKQALKEWENNSKETKKPTKPQQPKDLPLLTKEELSTLPSLPDGWVWVRLQNLAQDITDGDHQPPLKTETGIPFIVISNIKNNKIDFSQTMFVSDEYYQKLKVNRKPRIGDILYTVTGSFGIPCLVNFEKEFCFQRHIGLIRLYSMIEQKYMYYLLQAHLIYQQAQELATGTAQKTVSLTVLRQFKTPLPSPQEQTQIVQEIESRLSICDKLEVTLTENLNKAEALRQSILKRAFEGKLVL